MELSCLVKGRRGEDPGPLHVELTLTPGTFLEETGPHFSARNKSIKLMAYEQTAVRPILGV